MLPTALVVALAAFLVQVSDAKEIDRARVDGLEQYIGRVIEEKDTDSSAQRKNENTAGIVGGRLHSGFFKDTVKKDGFWKSLWFINVRLVKGGLAWIRELLAMPYYIFRISQYKAMALLGKD